MNNENLRFSELQKALPDITKKMLTAKLKELEADGIVKREVYPEVPPRVEYSLTEYGVGLEPLLLSLRAWGENHLESVKG